LACRTDSIRSWRSKRTAHSGTAIASARGSEDSHAPGQNIHEAVRRVGARGAARADERRRASRVEDLRLRVDLLPRDASRPRAGLPQRAAASAHLPDLGHSRARGERRRALRLPPRRPDLRRGRRRQGAHHALAARHARLRPRGDGRGFRRRCFSSGGCMRTVALLLALFAGLASAQTPARPLRVLVPFSAGGASDTYSRLAALKITEQTGRTIVVENRTGAGGRISWEAVARAAPDGPTAR